MNLKDAVDLAVDLTHAIPTCDDSTILDGLAGSDVDRGVRFGYARSVF